MRLVLVFAAVLLTTACGPQPIEYAQPSADALAREVLGALARRDHARLHALALSEREFERRVWPGLPAARPERNMPWSYVWMDLRQKSNGRLSRTLAEHGGRRYSLEQVRFAGDRTDHGNFRVHRRAVLLVRDSDGRPVELRILGSLLEADGGWKVFSYLVDE